jgi:hypothetical protein
LFRVNDPADFTTRFPFKVTVVFSRICFPETSQSPMAGGVAIIVGSGTVVDEAIGVVVGMVGIGVGVADGIVVSVGEGAGVTVGAGVGVVTAVRVDIGDGVGVSLGLAQLTRITIRMKRLASTYPVLEFLINIFLSN